jgi:hypothetical protein
MIHDAQRIKDEKIEELLRINATLSMKRRKTLERVSQASES